MAAIGTALQQQINEMRNAANSIRKGIEQTREQVDDWQHKADEARALVAVLKEKARIWDALADALDGGQLDDIVVPLGTGPELGDDAENSACGICNCPGCAYCEVFDGPPPGDLGCLCKAARNHLAEGEREAEEARFAEENEAEWLVGQFDAALVLGRAMDAAEAEEARGAESEA